MLLRSVTFENFGLYGGVHTFDLAPDTTGQFDRPVVLFSSGKNGVGKTTFVEGIRLCLHGPLALGSRFPASRSTKPTCAGASTTRPQRRRWHMKTRSSAVEVHFDFTSVGKRVTYRVRRTWSLHNGRLLHDLCLWEDGVLLDTLTPDERETLLREPPPGWPRFSSSTAKKLALASETGDQALLAATVDALLGINWSTSCSGILISTWCSTAPKACATAPTTSWRQPWPNGEAGAAERRTRPPGARPEAR